MNANESKHSRLYDHLEKATTSVVFLGVITVIYVCLWSYFHPDSNSQPAVELQRGNIIAGLPKVVYEQSPRTLLIAVDTKCSYCQQSAAFYKRLSELKNINRSQVVAIFSDEEGAAQQFLQRYQLNIETATSVNLRTLGITGTPTLVLVDSQGRIGDIWQGILTTEQEQQVIKVLNQPAT